MAALRVATRLTGSGPFLVLNFFQALRVRNPPLAHDPFVIRALNLPANLACRYVGRSIASDASADALQHPLQPAPSLRIHCIPLKGR